MGNFRRDNRSGGGYGGRDSGRPTMHRATCSECGKDCEVPFRPTGEKPVYCSDCFRGKDNDAPRRSGSRDFGRSNSRDRQMYSAVCDKCGQKCEVPFKPSSDKPIYCSNCFDKGDRGNKGSGQGGKQLDEINAKLDLIMTSLGLTGVKKEVKKTVVVKPKEVASLKTKKVVKPKKVVKVKATPKKTIASKKTKAKAKTKKK
ncbi:MAG: CxxC-x17-CxxC domain-containing protein [Candidatus Komeilibacteria bacterium]